MEPAFKVGDLVRVKLEARITSITIDEKGLRYWITKPGNWVNGFYAEPEEITKMEAPHVSPA